jgi:hypothetical protein
VAVFHNKQVFFAVASSPSANFRCTGERDVQGLRARKRARPREHVRGHGLLFGQLCRVRAEAEDAQREPPFFLFSIRPADRRLPTILAPRCKECGELDVLAEKDRATEEEDEDGVQQETISFTRNPPIHFTSSFFLLSSISLNEVGAVAISLISLFFCGSHGHFFFGSFFFSFFFWWADSCKKCGHVVAKHIYTFEVRDGFQVSCQ